VVSNRNPNVPIQLSSDASEMEGFLSLHLKN